MFAAGTVRAETVPAIETVLVQTAVPFQEIVTVVVIGAPAVACDTRIVELLPAPVVEIVDADPATGVVPAVPKAIKHHLLLWQLNYQ